MGKFSYLQKKAVTETAEAEFTLYQLEGEPVLTVAPATEANRDFFNAFLKRTGNIQRTSSTNKSLTSRQLKQIRNEDRVLFSKHIVKDWDGIVDDKGKPVEFSYENSREFLDALPDHIFDDLRAFAREPSNFLEDSDETIDAENTAKN